MTREEAKREIEKVFEPAFANYIVKALTDGATESDAEPQGDLISREAVLNTLDNMDKALDENRTVEAYKDLLKECFKELPPVEQTEWISVKDRLPKEHEAEECLVTYTYTDCKGNHVCIGIDIYRCGEWWYHTEDEYEHVTAWMPLPTPYKGGIKNE